MILCIDNVDSHVFTMKKKKKTVQAKMCVLTP